MNQLFACLLPERAFLLIRGRDRVAFLQNLVSNDVTQVTKTHAVYAALLTPQGKYLHDMFILEFQDGLLLECSAKRLPDFMTRLEAYRLRSKVTFENVTHIFNSWAVWGDTFAAITAFLDPRLDTLGSRLFLAHGERPPSSSIVPFTNYEDLRLAHGVPDGDRDLEFQKSTLIEANFDFLNGIDWKKGCYVGQELTARMHYRGLAKKRIFPVTLEEYPSFSSAALDDETGELRSVHGQTGLALLKIETVQKVIAEGLLLKVGQIYIRPTIPTWMKIDAREANR